MNPANIQRAILPREASNTTHIVSIIGKLVAPETIDVWIKDISHGREAVEVFAIYTLRTKSAREEEAEVGAGRLVGARVARVFGDVAA